MLNLQDLRRSFSINMESNSGIDDCDVNQGRLVIDGEKLAILSDFFSKGMDSARKEKVHLIQKCAEQTDLSERQVRVKYSCSYCSWY